MFKTPFKGGIWWGISISAAVYLTLGGIVDVLRFMLDPEYKGTIGVDIAFGVIGVAFLVWDIIVYRQSVKLLVEAEDELNEALFSDYGILLNDAPFQKAPVK